MIKKWEMSIDYQLKYVITHCCLSNETAVGSVNPWGPINSLIPEVRCSFTSVLVKLSLRIDILVNIGLGNGLVPSGNKPLPESVLTYVATWCD